MIKKILFISILFFSVVGFSQKKSLQELTAFPNPFSNTTAISFNTTSSQPVSINIKNVLGKVVYSQKINATSGKNTVPFYRNNLRSGIYIYTIQTNKDFISKRFVIK